MTTQTLLGALRRDGDRRAVHFDRRYACAPGDLWDAVTSPGRVARWLAPLSGELQEGGAYALDFDDDHRVTGVVQECSAPTRLTVTWDFPGEPTSVVRVELVAEPDGGTLLVLDHTALPQDQAAGYGAGWQAHLAGLGTEAAGEPAGNWDERFTALFPAYRDALAAE